MDKFGVASAPVSDKLKLLPAPVRKLLLEPTTVSQSDADAPYKW